MYVLVILKSIIIVGLLIACSKYAFNLGKSFINEALRNADRLHAIAFGKFYLQAFGDRISSPEEIKEVFQNWNIDKDSAFQKLDTNSYDPKFNESLVEIIKNLSEKVKNNASNIISFNKARMMFIKLIESFLFFIQTTNTIGFIQYVLIH
jgi:translation elongation factor EF-G